MNQIGKQRGENKNRNGYPTINPGNTKIQNQQRVKGAWHKNDYKYLDNL